MNTIILLLHLFCSETNKSRFFSYKIKKINKQNKKKPIGFIHMYQVKMSFLSVIQTALDRGKRMHIYVKHAFIFS